VLLKYAWFPPCRPTFLLIGEKSFFLLGKTVQLHYWRRPVGYRHFSIRCAHCERVPPPEIAELDHGWLISSPLFFLEEHYEGRP